MLLKDAELDIQNTPANLRPENMSLSKIDNELLLNLRDAGHLSRFNAVHQWVCASTKTPGLPVTPTTSFWNNPTLLTAYQGVGATYGQYSGAPLPTGAAANPIVVANQAWVLD
jgi:hypothetical protein